MVTFCKLINLRGSNKKLGEQYFDFSTVISRGEIRGTMRKLSMIRRMLTRRKELERRASLS